MAAAKDELSAAQLEEVDRRVAAALARMARAKAVKVRTGGPRIPVRTGRAASSAGIFGGWSEGQYKAAKEAFRKYTPERREVELAQYGKHLVRMPAHDPVTTRLAQHVAELEAL